MRVVSNLTIIFYSLFFLLIGILLILTAVNVLSRDLITYTLDFIYTNANMRLVVGITGGLFMIVTLLFIQIVVGRMQMERTIAFDNPDGQVTISLSAIEDFIKRLIKQLPEIKELKPNVIATKRGIDITLRLILHSDINIPEITERAQSLVKGRIQDILGIEEPIFVKVHIAKIAQKEESREVKSTEKAPPPFRGIEY
ncbi:MAG: alkaline shock response membrane anchor protein AmaP [Candidatus Omnitrophica bacterium]|nr:alkaline shock response membrane anchor protein AmaP [Candidatus Omnitrophota bacterium]